MTVYKISKQKWQRGKRFGGKLFDPGTCTMCVTGQILEHMGVAKEDMENAKCPTDIKNLEKYEAELPAIREIVYRYEAIDGKKVFIITDAAYYAMEENDVPNKDDEERMKELTRILAEYGIDIEFVE